GAGGRARTVGDGRGAVGAGGRRGRADEVAEVGREIDEDAALRRRLLGHLRGDDVGGDAVGWGAGALWRHGDRVARADVGARLRAADEGGEAGFARLAVAARRRAVGLGVAVVVDAVVADLGRVGRRADRRHAGGGGAGAGGAADDAALAVAVGIGAAD